MQIAYIWHATKSIIFGVLIDFLHLTFQFAFASLIILNGLMDLWICFKICVILYWALIWEDWRIAYQENSLPQTAFFQPNLFFTNIFLHLWTIRLIPGLRIFLYSQTTETKTVKIWNWNLCHLMSQFYVKLL